MSGAEPLEPAEVPPIPASLLEGLEEPGRAHLVELWNEFDWEPSKHFLLRMLCDLVNERAQARAAIAKQGKLLCRGSGASYANPMLRVLRQVETQLLAVHRELDLEIRA